MICLNKSQAFSLLIVALVVPLCIIDWAAEAQKTAANSYQQQQFSQGSNQNSVYGGYQSSSSSSRKQSSLVSPVNRPRRPSSQSSYSKTEQQTEIARQPQQPVYQQQESQYSSSSSSNSYDQVEADAEPPSYGAVAGAPGKDFPNYARVPKTSFSCDGLPYDYGMYADEETGCQAYHVCYNGRRDSFLCGPGTVFNQRILHCDYWYSVDCGKSSQYYGSNAFMGSSQPEPGPAQAQGSYQRSQSSYSSQSSGPARPVGGQSASSSTYNTRVQQPQPPPQQQQQQIQDDGY